MVIGKPCCSGSAGPKLSGHRLGHPGYQLGDLPTAVATASGASVGGVLNSVVLGTVTGMLVWASTNALARFVKAK